MIQHVGSDIGSKSFESNGTILGSTRKCQLGKRVGLGVRCWLNKRQRYLNELTQYKNVFHLTQYKNISFLMSM